MTTTTTTKRPGYGERDEREYNRAKLVERYGLSVAAAVAVVEAVEAGWKYLDLPQATKDALTIIPEQFGVRLDFRQRNHRGVPQMALAGISTDLQCSALFPHGQDLRTWARALSRASEFTLR